MTLAEIYARYHNPAYGLETHPDINIEQSKYKLGIFDHAVFLLILELQDIRKYYCLDNFDQDLGLDGNSFDLKVSVESPDSSIQKYTIISILCVFYKYRNNYMSGLYRASMLKIALKNMFMFKTKTPINPSYWCLFFAGAKKFPLAEALLFPLLAVNVLLTVRVREDLLNTVVLHAFNGKRRYKILRKIFLFKMKLRYGKNFIEKLVNLYYTDENHPARQYAKGIIKEL